jgi:hypothetical protein
MDIELDKVKKESKTPLYVLGGVVVVLLAYIGYIYASYDMTKKGIKETKNEVIVEEAPKTFESLPYDVQSNYIAKADHDNKLSQISNQLKQCNDSKAMMAVSKPEEKEKEIINNIIEKTVEVEKVVFKEKDPIDQSKFVTYSCYDMLKSGYHPSKTCIKRLKNFIDKHEKDTKLFEVIGVVDNQDFTLLTRLKDVYKNSRVDKIDEFAQYGLSRKRVIEGAWIVIRHLGSSKKVGTVNYTAKSNNGKRGFVVRAYK